MSDAELVPSTPNPSYVAIAAGVIRGLLQIASGVGFAWALTVNASQIQMAATALVMLLTLVWSVWQKIAQARAQHAAAVASASKRKAVVPAANPPPP